MLTATPNAGYQFLSWGGHVSGNSNPLFVTMNTNKTVIPRFRVPGDDFDQRIPLSGAIATYSLPNAGATKETGEPSHAGTHGWKICVVDLDRTNLWDSSADHGRQ